MDSDKFYQLLSQQVQAQALLRTLMYMHSQIMADQRSLSVSFVRNQFLDMADKNLDKELKRTGKLRESLGSDPEVLRGYLSGNRAILETLYHYQVRMFAELQDRPIAEVEDEIEEFYEAKILELS